MLTLKKRDTRLTDAPGGARRLRATVASVAVHGLVLVGLWQVLQFPRLVSGLLDRSDRPITTERLRYLTVAPPKTLVSGSARPLTPSAKTPSAPTPLPRQSAPPPQVPLVAPVEVPTGVSPPAPGAVPVVVNGPLVGGKGGAQGVQPGYSEPRIWIESPAVAAAPLVGEAKLDSAVNAMILAFSDSVAKNTYQPNKYERGDWTYTTKGGKRYGIDQQFIRLGKFSIPTALLGLLPMNQLQGNPIALDRQRRLDAARVEILAQAQTAMNEEDFRRAVRSIRDRKEKERKELEKKRKKEEKVISP